MTLHMLRLIVSKIFKNFDDLSQKTAAEKNVEKKKEMRRKLSEDQTKFRDFLDYMENELK